MMVFNITLNMISLFALVMAIGIVVDDAIVVIEAVNVEMLRNKLSPVEATEKAMKEISGAIIAISLVMASVFIPVAFMGGPEGMFYRQFSITMASSILFSAFVALTLTPALCALILTKEQEHNVKLGFVGKALQRFNARTGLLGELGFAVRVHSARRPGDDLCRDGNASGLHDRAHERCCTGFFEDCQGRRGCGECVVVGRL